MLKETQIKSKDKKDLKEKLFDKVIKLKKYDLAAFDYFFHFGCPKMFEPVKNIEEFKTINCPAGANDLQNKVREQLMGEFKSNQVLNDISSILKLYSKISIQKAAKLLSLGVEEFKEKLDKYKLRNMRVIRPVPFEETILNKFMDNTSQL